MNELIDDFFPNSTQLAVKTRSINIAWEGAFAGQAPDPWDCTSGRSSEAVAADVEQTYTLVAFRNALATQLTRVIHQLRHEEVS